MVVAAVYSVLSSTALQCVVLSYNTVDESDVTYGEYEYPRTGSKAPFLSVKVGGLSPPTFESGGAQAPPAPPISPPLIMYIHVRTFIYSTRSAGNTD